MKITDEMLIAFADGELDPKTREDVMRAVAADPELERKLAAHQRLRDTLSSHFAPIAGQPVPEHLKALLEKREAAPEPPRVVSLAAVRAERDEQRARQRRWLPGWGNMAAIAATLVLGLAVGQNLNPGSGPVAVEGGAMVAQGQLATALDTRLASAGQEGVGQEGAGTRIGLTFRSKAGDICRTFDGEAMSGLACHRGGNWKLEQILPGAAEATAYRQASASDPRLAASVQDMIAGQPFDAKSERIARDKGWTE